MKKKLKKLLGLMVGEMIELNKYPKDKRRRGALEGIEWAFQELLRIVEPKNETHYVRCDVNGNIIIEGKEDKLGVDIS